MATFKFGDLVTVIVLGRITEGIIVDGIDQDGDYKVAYDGGWNFFKTKDIKLRTPNVVPVQVPDLTTLTSKISAIKALREVTQWSLRDTKEVVEAIMVMSTTVQQGLHSDLLLARERIDELERKLRKLYTELDKGTLIDMLMK